jgi:hypothetical protein
MPPGPFLLRPRVVLGVLLGVVVEHPQPAEARRPQWPAPLADPLRHRAGRVPPLPPRRALARGRRAAHLLSRGPGGVRLGGLFGRRRPSSVVRGGRMPGSRRASIVLPPPGGADEQDVVVNYEPRLYVLVCSLVHRAPGRPSKMPRGGHGLCSRPTGVRALACSSPGASGGRQEFCPPRLGAVDRMRTGRYSGGVMGGTRGASPWRPELAKLPEGSWA